MNVFNILSKEWLYFFISILMSLLYAIIIYIIDDFRIGSDAFKAIFAIAGLIYITFLMYRFTVYSIDRNVTQKKVRSVLRYLTYVFPIGLVLFASLIAVDVYVKSKKQEKLNKQDIVWDDEVIQELPPLPDGFILEK